MDFLEPFAGQLRRKRCRLPLLLVGRAIGSGWRGPPNFREWSGPTSQRKFKNESARSRTGLGHPGHDPAYHGKLADTEIPISENRVLLTEHGPGKDSVVLDPRSALKRRPGAGFS